MRRDVIPFRPVSKAGESWPLGQRLEFERKAGRVR